MQDPIGTSGFNTLYDILGVAPTATEAQIREAHEKTHRLGKNNPSQRLINQAFLTLSHPQKKIAYDAKLTNFIRLFSPNSPERIYFASKNKPEALIPVLAPPQSEFINKQLILFEYQRYNQTDRAVVLAFLLKNFLPLSAELSTSQKYFSLFKLIGKSDPDGCMRALFYRMFNYIKHTILCKEIYRPGALSLFRLQEEFSTIDPKSLSLKDIETYITFCQSIPSIRKLGLFTVTETNDVTYCKSICRIFFHMKSAHETAARKVSSETQIPVHEVPLRPLIRVY